MTTLDVPHYFPQFLWKFWLNHTGESGHSLDQNRVHIYDVDNNLLSETRRIPERRRRIFQDFDHGDLDGYCSKALRDAESAYALLESEVEHVLDDVLLQALSLDRDAKKKGIRIMRRSLNIMRRFFVFLRYRNSDKYCTVLNKLLQTPGDPTNQDVDRSLSDIRRRIALENLYAFLRYESAGSFDVPLLATQELKQHCWRYYQADLFLGIASEGQEFVLSDSCFGTLDEDFGIGPKESQCDDLFFPIAPTVALYLFSGGPDAPHRSDHQRTMWVECGFESASDVHLRNAMILHSSPRHLYFSSLLAVSKSISSYDEFRCFPDNMDYNRLKARCRQKHTVETVTKTLVIKGSFILTDLTDDVVVGQSAVAHGSFSDVFKGVWTDPIANESKTVALKVLRQIMCQNIKEKMLQRLKDEVLAWYRLQHSNIAPLYGVVQHLNSIAMVSPWCEHGSLIRYLKEVQPSADRLNLLIQVADGVSYLHNFKPTVVHGDLKGGNVLVDQNGNALITDFGLSKVMEEFSETMKLTTSFFGGSTRWLAPEVLLALVEDDGKLPPITTSSDVYAFGSLCLEVASGQVPYPHRSNDHAVVVDIMRGVKPSRGASCNIRGNAHESFWEMLDRCWENATYLRPSMTEVTTFLRGIAISSL